MSNPEQVALLPIPEGILDRPRLTAREVLIGVAGGLGYYERQVVAVEVAMNNEWWLGYAAAIAASRPPAAAQAEGVEAASRAICRLTCGDMDDANFAARAKRCYEAMERARATSELPPRPANPAGQYREDGRGR